MIKYAADKISNNDIGYNTNCKSVVLLSNKDKIETIPKMAIKNTKLNNFLFEFNF
jgi:hypothetical protein